MNSILAVTILIISKPVEVLNQANPTNNYGPYKMDLLQHETCKGPKKGECGTVVIVNIHNTSDITYVLDFPYDCPVKNAKITMGIIQNNNKSKRLWNYQLNKPCQHFVLGPVLSKSFNVTETCNIVKGHYEVHINMNDLSKKFLGSSFFYDTYFFKAIAYNDLNNFFCVHTAIKISKQ